MRKSFLRVTDFYAVRPIWPGYGILHEVIEGNLALHGLGQNHKVSEKLSPLDAMQARLIVEWIKWNQLLDARYIYIRIKTVCTAIYTTSIHFIIFILYVYVYFTSYAFNLTLL